MILARNPRPVPCSPSIRTGVSVSASRWTRETASWTVGLVPTTAPIWCWPRASALRKRFSRFSWRRSYALSARGRPSSPRNGFMGRGERVGVGMLKLGEDAFSPPPLVLPDPPGAGGRLVHVPSAGLEEFLEEV